MAQALAFSVKAALSKMLKMFQLCFCLTNQTYCILTTKIAQ